MTQTIKLRFEPERTGPTVTFEYQGHSETLIYGPDVSDAIFTSLVRGMVERGPVGEHDVLEEFDQNRRDYHPTTAEYAELNRRVSELECQRIIEEAEAPEHRSLKLV